MVIRISNIDTICWIWRSVIKFAIFLRSNTLIFSQTIIITFTMASWMDASTIASWWPLCVTIGNYTVSLWMCRQWTSITKENRRTHRIEHISPVVISKALMKGIALITHIFNFHVVCNQRIDINSKCTGNYHLFLSHPLSRTHKHSHIHGCGSSSMRKSLDRSSTCEWLEWENDACVVLCFSSVVSHSRWLPRWLPVSVGTKKRHKNLNGVIIEINFQMTRFICRSGNSSIASTYASQTPSAIHSTQIAIGLHLKQIEVFFGSPLHTRTSRFGFGFYCFSMRITLRFVCVCVFGRTFQTNASRSMPKDRHIIWVSSRLVSLTLCTSDVHYIFTQWAGWCALCACASEYLYK